LKIGCLHGKFSLPRNGISPQQEQQGLGKSIDHFVKKRHRGGGTSTPAPRRPFGRLLVRLITCHDVVIIVTLFYLIDNKPSRMSRTFQPAKATMQYAFTSPHCSSCRGFLLYTWQHRPVTGMYRWYLRPQARQSQGLWWPPGFPR